MRLKRCYVGASIGHKGASSARLKTDQPSTRHIGAEPLLELGGSHCADLPRFTESQVSLLVDDQRARDKGRIVALRLILHTLRLMENWKHDVNDYDRAMILLAVAAITAERLLRGETESQFEALSEPLPIDRMAKCNVRSIAAATGLNRETTRRKVDGLIEQNLLVKAGDGTLTFAPGIIQEETTYTLIRKQLDTFVKTANELIREGVVKQT